MARNTFADVRSTNFMKDGFRKEDDSALKFFIRHKDEFLSDEACGANAMAMRTELARIIADQERSCALARESEEKRRQEAEEKAKKEEERRKEFARKSPDFSAVNMRPVSPITRALLYNGVSQEGAGRRRLARHTIKNAVCEEVLRNVQERQRLQEKEEEQKSTSREEDCLQVQDVSELDMHRASPRTRAFLYNGVSHNGEGRAKYLRERYKKAPEEKFPARYPVSWDLGWRLGDTIKPLDVKKSPFARVTVVEGAFYSRNGIFFPEEDNSRKKLFR
ncbi:hypothetical protein SprV_0100154200 [Sparganum proliferum]